MAAVKSMISNHYLKNILFVVEMYIEIPTIRIWITVFVHGLDQHYMRMQHVYVLKWLI